MPKGKKPSYYSSLLPDNIRIRQFEPKDYDGVHRIYANSTSDNVQYAVREIMQHRFTISLWLALTFLTIKNYQTAPEAYMLGIFCAWGIFLYVNLRRAVINFITYETKYSIHRDLVKIPEKYNTDQTITDKEGFEGKLKGNGYSQRLARFWVAMDKEAGNRVIAFLALNDEDDLQKNNTCIVDQTPRIKYMCVEKLYPNCEIAAAMLEHTIKFVNRRGGKRVAISINAAYCDSLDVVDEFGFRETGRESSLFGLLETVNLRLDVEQWVRFRKARKEMIAATAQPRDMYARE